jgi:hypothetical protein
LRDSPVGKGETTRSPDAQPSSAGLAAARIALATAETEARDAATRADRLEQPSRAEADAAVVADPAAKAPSAPRTTRGVPEGLWQKCEGCGATIYRKEAEEMQNVCPQCGFHWYVSAAQRIAQLLDAGTFEMVTYDKKSRVVRVRLTPSTADTPVARLRVETTAKGFPPYQVSGYSIDAGAYKVPLGTGNTELELRP